MVIWEDEVSMLCITVAYCSRIRRLLLRTHGCVIAARSVGLLYLDAGDPRVVAMLVGLSRRSSNSWSAAEALGRFSLKDPVAWQELLRRFVTAEAEDWEF